MIGTGTSPGLFGWSRSMFVSNHKLSVGESDLAALIKSVARSVLKLAYFSGLKATEIAKRLNQSIGAVKSVMRSGMIKLRAQLESIRKEEKVSTVTLLQKG